MRKLAVLGALSAELEPLWNSMQGYESASWGVLDIRFGRIGSRDVISFATGVGKVRAAAGVQFVIDHYGPSAVLFIGAAGALNPELEPGQVIVGERIIEHDFDIRTLAAEGRGGIELWEPDSRLLKTALKASQRAVGVDRVRAGMILTGDQVIVDAERRDQLRKIFGGDCVEMEGAAVAIVCSHNGVPFVVIRILSDSADQSARIHFDETLDFVGSTSARIVQEFLEIDSSELSAQIVHNSTNIGDDG